VIGRPLPAGLDAALMRALDRSLARRTPSAAAFAEQLEQVIQAAGDQTLEAWTERALAGPREAHRRWLAEVTSGRDAPRPPMGRATGAVTQLPPEQAAALAAADDDEPPIQPPRRRRVAPILLALAGMLGVLGVLGVVLLRDRRGASAPAPALDAAIIAVIDPAIDAPAPIDAAIDAPEASAAAPPLDGPPADAPRRRPRIDAGALTAARDAAVPLDAAASASAPASAPAETGRISIVGRGEAFLNVLVDGLPFQVTPQLRKPIAAGRHTIVLLDPKTNQVVYQTTVVVEPGKHVRVQPP
jgi:hypothetical protein